MKPTVNILYRPAQQSDAATIARMSRRHIEHGLVWRWTEAKVRRQIRDKETMVLIASREGVTAGFAIMRFGDDVAHLFLLAVDPEFRRQGIGASLMQWLEKSCRTAGIRQIRLEVRASNLAAQRFYQRLGYRFLARISAYYDCREAAVVLARSLIGTG